MAERRTKRRFAHELYPHAVEGETRHLSIEVPYLYALTVGLEVWGTSWFDCDPKESVARTIHLMESRRIAFLADAMHQGLTGQEAWEWADQCAWDETGEIAYERAIHYGVPVAKIKPYACGPEPDHHDHYSDMENRSGLTTRIKGREDDCPECTEDDPAKPDPNTDPIPGLEDAGA